MNTLVQVCGEHAVSYVSILCLEQWISLHEITNIRGYKVSVYVTYTEQYTDI